QRRTGVFIPYDEGFEFLSAAKRARLREIDRQYDAKVLAARSGVAPAEPGDPSGEGRAHEWKDTAIKELLSQEEFQEYQIRFGDHSGYLRGALRAFEPTEQEFRKIFEIQNQLAGRA